MRSSTFKKGLYCLITVGLAIMAYLVISTKPSSTPTTRASPPVSLSKQKPPKKKMLAVPSEEVMRQASLTLKDLVQSHPHRSIREDLNKMIESGKIFLNFQEEVVGSNNIAGVIWTKTPTHGTVLAFVFSPSGLTGSKHTRKFKQLVIYHEYQHILQQLSRRYPAALVSTNKGVDPKHLRLFFEAESEAYEKESQLAIQLGWENQFDLCKTYKKNGLTAMRQQLAANLAASSPHLGAYSKQLFEFANQPPLRR